MKKNPIKTTPGHGGEELFVTWHDEKSKKAAFKKASKALNQSCAITRATHTSFRNIVDNTTVRQEFSRRDYEHFRPSESVPSKPKEIIKVANKAYRKVGLIRNVIDLMGDFACQGVNLVHQNARIEKFYRQWFKKVKGKDRSERFLNLLYRLAIVPVKRSTAKLKKGQIDKLRRGLAAADVEAEPPPNIEKNEIPWRYNFLNPLAIEVINDELSSFAGTTSYAMRISPTVARKINHPKTQAERKIVQSLPDDIRAAISRGQKVIPLNPEKVSIFHYKKDDWEPWADPMTFAILDDVILLDKMKLADLAALDGAISHVRLWKLGDLENRILPTPEAISRLSDILTSNIGGGSIDLIWGPAITLDETSTDVQEFLGNEKYVPVLNAIHAGLGIPPTLSGTATASGFTNNFISLRTLIERLEYGRDVLTAFWEFEIKLVQLAMGFRFPAEVVFDHMTLSDDAAERALLIQLADRDYISVETIQERFGEIPELEKMRVRREQRQRDNGQLPKKAGPWHDPQLLDSFKKIALRQGIVSPSEVGVELLERKDGEQPMLDMRRPPGNPNQEPDNPGEPQQGRPRNSKDSKPRKQKEVKPRTSAMILELWAKQTQNKISDIVNPMFLNSLNKKNMRSLSSEEFNNVEKLKFHILFQLEPFAKINKKSVAAVMQNPIPLPAAINLMYGACINTFIDKFCRLPEIDEIRQIQTNIYTIYKGDNDG